MFTGLVTDVGRVVSIEGSDRLRRIVIEQRHQLARDLRVQGAQR